MSVTTAEQWTRRYLAALLAVEADTIDFGRTLVDYGLDSVDVVVLAGDFEQAFAVEIDPSVFFPLPTIGGIVDILARVAAGSVRGGATA